jgi:hypothetical protein
MEIYVSLFCIDIIAGQDCFSKHSYQQSPSLNSFINFLDNDYIFISMIFSSNIRKQKPHLFLFS